MHENALITGPFLQSMGEMNNFVFTKDYAFINQIYSSGRSDIVKNISTCVIRTLPLLNQLVVGHEEILADFVLSRKVELLRNPYNLVGVKKVDIEKDYLEHLHGSPTKLVGQMKDLKSQLRKMENDAYQSELKAKITSIIVQCTTK